MRAIEVAALGGTATLVERPEPVPAAGESLVRVRAAAIGHIDLELAAGTFGIRPPTPFIPGSEASGEIVVSDSFPRGQTVRVRGGGVGARRDGTWAELVAVPDSALVPLRGEPDWNLAACYFSPAATAWASLHDVAAVAPGECVVVTGAAGAVGILAVQLAVAHGCTVIGTVGSASKLAHVPAAAVGVVAADHAAMDAALDGRQVDAAVDTVGGPALGELVRVVRPGGRVALVGYTGGDAIPVGIQALLLSDVSLLPVNLLRRSPSLVERGHDLLARLVAGELRLPVTAHPLERVAEAIGAVQDRRTVGKVVLRV